LRIKTAVFLALAFLLLASSSNVADKLTSKASVDPKEAIVNGGFESGDLTGWTADYSEPNLPGANVAVVTTNPHYGMYCAYLIGNVGVKQTFPGIPVSSVQSITFWGRTDLVLGLALIYSDGTFDMHAGVGYSSSWAYFDVTSYLIAGKVLTGIDLWGWAGSQLGNTYFDDVSILYTSPPQQSSTSVSCSPNPVSIFHSVTCTATVSGSNPTGTITWSTSGIGGSFSQSVCALSNGTCSTTYIDNFTGSVTIAAYYSGDSNNAPSSGSTSLTVTSGGPIYYSQNYTSVQAAIDAAAPGATVIIAPGFYTESLIVDKPLTIIGEKDPPVFGGGASSIYLTLLSGASGSTVTGIELTNWPEGILVDNASNCRIYSNIMASLGSSGIVLEGSNATNNVIFNNIFQDTPTPINLTASAGNNTIYGNIITSQTSVALSIGGDGNGVYSNSISGNEILVNMTNSNGNVIYHNNFLTATNITVVATGNNTWDNGYPSGGNYWSTAPYVVGSNNTDHYPIMKPWPLATGHCIAVISVVTPKTVVGQGFSANMTVCVADNGEYAESFSVTAYANATGIGTRQVSSLNSSCQMVLTFAWNTAGLAYGNYTVRTYAQRVANQTDVSGNDFTLGTVKVTVPGDIDGNFKVQLADLVILAKAYSAKPGNPNWNPNADIDGNGAVGLSDLVALAQHYGQHYP
jgi:parallel beta-helix repeat protein